MADELYNCDGAGAGEITCEKIREGNDIGIRWSLVDKDNNPYIFDGRDVAVEIDVAGKKRYRITDLTHEGNTLIFTFWGKDQKHTGVCSLKFIENDGNKEMVTFDVPNAFALVAHSWLTGSAPENERVQLSFVTLTSSLTERIGPMGPAAGFGEITATIDSLVGTPSVEVITSGPDTAKNITFVFSSLKGEPGHDAEVTAEKIISALGYTPANAATLPPLEKGGTATAVRMKNTGVVASGNAAFAIGKNTTASGGQSFASGDGATASGNRSHAEGKDTTAEGNNSHSEGQETTASGSSSHAEGKSTTASNNNAHAEGQATSASGVAAHAEGENTEASGDRSHAEGENTVASGNQSHAEGEDTEASGTRSHAEGGYTSASGNRAHAEGERTEASGDNSHAEGSYSTASGSASHAEGKGTEANGKHSHAEGIHTEAMGDYSHAEGEETVAQNRAEHAQGYFNKSNVKTNGTDEENDAGSTLFSIGNGSDVNRKNAFEIMRNGDVYIQGAGGYAGKNPTAATSLQTLLASFITNSVNNLVNYYTKSETFTKAEVLAQIADAIKGGYMPVATLPTASADTMGKIYLVPSTDPQTQNIKDEFVTIDNGASADPRYTWEQIGSTAISLDGLVRYDESQTLSTAEKTRARGNIGAQESLVSGTNIKKFAGKDLLGSGDVTITLSRTLQLGMDRLFVFCTCESNTPEKFSALINVPNLNITALLSAGTNGEAILYDYSGQVHSFYSSADGDRYWLIIEISISTSSVWSGDVNVVCLTGDASNYFFSCGGNGSCPSSGTSLPIKKYYSKPSGGIPKTDLVAAVQTSLEKADSALQSVKTLAGQSLSGTGDVVSQITTSSSESYLNIYGAGFSNSSFIITASDGGVAVLEYFGGPRLIALQGDWDELWKYSDEIYTRCGTSAKTYNILRIAGEDHIDSGKGALPSGATDFSANILRLYSKPSTGIPSTDLAQAVQNALAPEIFWATYGTTTRAEIIAAVNAGKEVMCYLNFAGLIYRLNNYEDAGAFTLTSISASSYVDNLVLNAAGEWSHTGYYVEKTSNLRSSWQATPDNSHYPSEKLVKDSLDAKPSLNIFKGTCSSAASAMPKVCTVDSFPTTTATVGGNTVTHAPDGILIAVTFAASDTNTTAAPKLNVNGIGAKSIVYSNAIVTSTAKNTIVAGTKNITAYYYYDSSLDDGNGAWVYLGHSTDTNTTYSAMSQAEVDAGTVATGRVISPKMLRDNFYTKSEIDATVGDIATLLAAI